MIRFAGSDLLFADELPDEWAQLDLSRYALFGDTAAVAQRDTEPVCNAQPRLQLPIPNYPPRHDALRLNQLYWPTGAARWSSFVGLTTWETLQEILQQFTPVDDRVSRGLARRTLVLGDSQFADDVDGLDLGHHKGESGRQCLSTEMYLLTPQPLALTPEVHRPDGVDQPWLVPLVDVRYFWHQRRLPHRVEHLLREIDDDGNKETQEQLKEDWYGWLIVLQDAIERVEAGTPDGEVECLLKFDPDPLAEGERVGIEGTHFYPDRTELDRLNGNAALLLGAVAHSTGRRFVRTIDGQCLIQDPATSRDAHTLNAETTASQMRCGGSRAVQVGDELESQTAVIDAALRRQTLYPEFVEVVYRKLAEWDDHHLGDLPDVAESVSPYEAIQQLVGTGTRSMRVSLPAAFDVGAVTPRDTVTIYTPSWVGAQWWSDGSSVQ